MVFGCGLATLTSLGLLETIATTSACEVAMLRTRVWEAHRQEGISWSDLRAQQCRAWQDTEYSSKAGVWRSWLSSPIATTVENHDSHNADKRVGYRDLRLQLVSGMVGPLDRQTEAKFRKQTQGWFVQLLFAETRYDVHARLRRRLCRWRLTGWPGRTARRVQSQLM
jgi:hypothetical protein